MNAHLPCALAACAALGCSRSVRVVDAGPTGVAEAAARAALSPEVARPPWRWALTALTWTPPVAWSVAVGAERIVAPGLTLATAHRFEHHGRGRVACQYDVPRAGVVCVTDALSADWRVKGVRVVRFDASRGAVEERVVSRSLHSSFLWGDFNRDAALDFWGFSDETEDADARAVLYLGTSDPWVFRATRPLAMDHPALGGAVLDADGDGCEDVLVLGTGLEFQRDRPVTYFRDALFVGDCRGGFVSGNARLGLHRVADFEGESASPPRLGRTAVVTDLDGDRCADLVVGNYRAHADTFARRVCGGAYEPWRHAPDVPPRELFGHAVAMFPWDHDLRGALDLHVFNLWHDDWRGRLTDRSYLLRTSAGAPRREENPQVLEAPFGAAVADFDGDRAAETLLVTGPRWQPYRGAATLWRDGREVWRDAQGWLTMREVPSVVDVNLDGAPDLVGDGRVLVQPSRPGARRWIGFIFLVRSASGSVVVLEDESGGRAAFALAADGRGQPSNLLTVGLGAQARPTRLVIYEGATGRASVVDVSRAAIGRYHGVRAIVVR